MIFRVDGEDGLFYGFNVLANYFADPDEVPTVDEVRRVYEVGENGRVKAIECVRVEWVKDDSGRMQMQEIAGSEFTLQAELRNPTNVMAHFHDLVSPRHVDEPFIHQAKQ